MIKTDHQSLKYLLEQRLVTPNQQKWLTKLLGLDYTIEYKSGSTNLAADALSKVRDQSLNNITVSVTMPELMEEIKNIWTLLRGYDKVIIQ